MVKFKAKLVFEKIVIQHLQDHFGTFEKHKNSRYWKVDNKVVRIYYYTDPRSEFFINAISRNTLENMQNENSYFVGANYYSKNKNMFTVYFVRPETIQKLYIDDGIECRAEDNEWLIKIKHKDNSLIFYRKCAEEVVIPIDDNNYYVQFIMTDNEYRDLYDVLPKTNLKANLERHLSIYC